MLEDSQRFVLLPPRGIRMASSTPNSALRSFLTRLPRADGAHRALAFRVPNAPQLKFKVLDSVSEDGAKLVELNPALRAALKAEQPGLRIVPVRYFRKALAPRPRPLPMGRKSTAGTARVSIEMQVVSAVDGTPLQGVVIDAFIDYDNLTGASATTDKHGVAKLHLGGSKVLVERLYAQPKLGFWGLLRRRTVLRSGLTLRLQPLDLAAPDALRHFYGEPFADRGQGVRVAVIDGGVGPHPDLTLAGGENTVLGESSKLIGDSGDGHGTHVAGIIAARGKPPSGLHGLAPGVELLSFRVFGQNSDLAANFSIAKAIDQAAAKNCDLINLSLELASLDEPVEAAILEARAKGCMVIAAAGNGSRAPVSYPASAAHALAVSALGRKGTFPANAAEAGDVAAPYGKPDQTNFVAAFSNVGSEVDLIAPGVGILSTVPDGYAAMCGTSMACPAVTGIAARLLGKQKKILGMPRNSARADAMVSFLLHAAGSLGFGPEFEGRGLL